MEYILITGSNRGIGLALVREWLNRDAVHVLAACRDPENATELREVASANPQSVSLIRMDVSDTHSVASALETVREITPSLDVLVNNAGIYPKHPEAQDFGSLQAEDMLAVLTTNAVAPVIVTQTFVPLMRGANRPRVVMISSYVGSITDNRSSNGISYRMSKTALNMATKALSNELRTSGIIVVTTHPGHVATDMGGKYAPVSPEESAAGLVALTERLTAQHSGNFYNYDGKSLPW